MSPRLQTYSGSAIKTLLDTSLTLYCTYYGEPTPNINWTKTGGLVSSSATISVSVISKNSSFAVVNSTLQFAKVKKSDFGTYNCFAQNSVGSLSKNISVDVQCKSSFEYSLFHAYSWLFLCCFQQTNSSVRDFLLKVSVFFFARNFDCPNHER